MKLRAAAFALSLIPLASGQTCSGVSGSFALEDITGPCTYDVLVQEYTRQVFDAAGATCMAGSTLTAREDLDAKLTAAVPSAATGEEAGAIVCKKMYDGADQTPFTEAAGKGTNYHFEQMFYNGLSDWQDEVETIHESADGSASSVLREDAARVREFYQGLGSYSRVEWPDMLTNFEPSTCDSHAAMCCWPKDRQANDGNGNCATEYDENCVDKDPADNTNLCFADLAQGNLSSDFDSNDGFMVFPEDNGNGEGAIHCHGFAWADDEYDSISRYIGNNLFFVSMYDHMHQRGYVKNIPGMPMCGCMDQMPVATRSDCTQVDLTEDWRMVFDGTSFTGELVKVEVDFNACRGRNNRNNDLWAYAARLYDEGRMTRHQFGAVGRKLTNDHDCYHATEYEKAKKGFVVGYDHDKTMWTIVAGRDDMYDGHPFGKEAFDAAFWDGSLTKPLDMTVAEFPDGQTPIIMRTCPDCAGTHRKIFYRRLTPVTDDNFHLLHHIVYERGNDGNGQNKWNEDFSLHSTYEDAVSGDNPWQCPGDAFNYWAPFYGECSPSGAKVRDQYSIWSWFPGPRPNVAYYVNTPQDEGIQELDLLNSARFHAGHTDVDLGDVGIPGRTFENDDGSIHISGSGWDIWNTNDMGHYFSDLTTGDVDVSVHISSFTNIRNGWAKAGIMLRSNNDDDATNVFALLSGSAGVGFQKRSSKGRYSETIGSYYKDTPIQTSAWLRVVKKMETVECYRSDDGSNWVLHGSTNILFPDDTFRVGLAVTSHDDRHVSEATFEDYTVAAYEAPTSAPSTSSAPTPWQPMVDIGEPQQPGQFFTSADGTIDYVKGSGDGIWGSSDSFFFYDEQRPNDDFTVEMYINKYETWTDYSRGGLMIRDDNSPGAANVFVGAAGNRGGATFQSRGSAGASTVHHQTTFVNNQNQFWVRLAKVGSVVTASYKKNGAEAEWIELGSTDLTLTGATVQVGRAVTAGDDYQWALHTMETKHFSIA